MESFPNYKIIKIETQNINLKLNIDFIIEP
jgi:hypothetical protein